MKDYRNSKIINENKFHVPQIIKHKNNLKDYRNSKMKKDNKYVSINYNEKLCTFPEKNVHSYLKLILRKKNSNLLKDKLKIVGNSELIFKKDKNTIFRNNTMIKFIDDHTIVTKIEENKNSFIYQDKNFMINSNLNKIMS